MDLYVRVCQECGHKQVSKPPSEYKGSSWTLVKCKKCKSAAMDYGSSGWDLDPNTKELVRIFE